ncbi:MAG: HAD-IA family hydrolase [Actinomycetota bacterium]|nr:HAD-IA family hydrolase [Actinomycetota bacterium]
MRGIDIVFFDAGETLLHPHPSFPELFALTAQANGHDVSVADATEVQLRLAPHLVELAEDTGVANPSLQSGDSLRFWSFLYRRLLKELGIEDEDLVSALYSTFSDISSYALFDDVLPALQRLEAEGYRLGLISNFEGWLEEMLVELEIGNLFEVRIVSGIEGVEKPDPRIYELALQRAGAEAHAAVHVGDSPAMDVEPAATAGIRPVLLDRLGRYGDQPGTVISSLNELAGVMSDLAREPEIPPGRPHRG